MVVLLAINSIVTFLPSKITNAAEVGADDTYNLTYDKSKYTAYWMARKTINAYSQYGSMWSKLSKNSRLGSATVRYFYLEPKSKINGLYYGVSGCQISMDPQIVNGNITGMSQYAEFKITTVGADSRVCTPSVGILNAQATKAKSSDGNFEAGASLQYNSNKKTWEPSADLKITSSWGVATSYTYNISNVNFIQKNKDGNYAAWTYDYKSHDGDSAWNAYLMSSSKVTGQVVFNMGNVKPTGASKAPITLYVEVRFGAGNQSTGKVANRIGLSSNRDMFVYSKYIRLEY